ncbi:wax ester/triacylglycerol synthase family O-acyltransferase [uncultured Aquimarina sp.]|uniref:wax ester/triacylglycerol synthase family O-acyltransferase n=1 Tax=uncultured Aquimarina sp. TaxID=575652 RepID=UPI002610E5E1|nr:wax ester/triacylglycerol synthase family O-acyltransferase [uncultured Aquimarina sp.]
MSKKKAIKNLLDDALDDTIKQVSGQDATFLYADSPTSPMHIGTLTIVEDSLNFEDFKAIIASKLHLIPKFRQRLLNVPLKLDYPYWVDDPNFDLDLHLNRIKLPDPANWKTLREVTSSIFSDPLDPNRPLWSVSFIEGLDEISQIPKGSVAIVIKIHHVMIDGSSGVGIMGVLFDKNEEDKNKPPAPPKPYDPDPLPDELSLLLKSSYKFLKDPLRIPKTIGETAYAVVKGQATSKMMGKKEFKANSFSVPKTIFNGSISPKRTWGTAILSFDRIYALRKIMDVTINDVIVAICAGGIRKYLQEKEKLPAQPLVANVPISIRVKGEKQKMNNQISNMLVQIGTHIEDPIKRLEFIYEQTDLGKTRNKAVGAKTLSKMADSVPFGLANLAANVYTKYNIKEFHRPPFNVTITNVPGPSGKLYIKGHEIVSIFGLTPVVDGFGLIIAAFSYNGLVTITTTSDAKTMPDADTFSRYIRESANELEAVIKKRGRKATKPTTVKLKSTAFFTALNKYVKNSQEQIKKFKGTYQFKVSLDKTEAYWNLHITAKTAELKKQKSSKPTATLEIEDANLNALYKGKLLFEELKIQDRIKFSGKNENATKLEQLITQFLNK